MKTVKRIGVFETNSSSIHSMSLVSRDALEEDAKAEKPKYAKYKRLTSKADKLYMACGCCHELYDDNGSYDDAKDRVGDYATLLRHADDLEYYCDTCCGEYDIKYGVAIELLVGVYCELTGEDFEKLRQSVLKINKSGRACHMRFFYEGALYDADSDYYMIDDMFLRGPISTIIKRIRKYFDDDNVLCCREYWNGMGYGED